MLDLAYPERYVPEIREPESDCNPAVRWHPGRLWSLWDMLTVFARPFVLLQELQEHLTAVLDICENLDLSVSKELITDAKSDPPNNEREFAVLTKALYAEIRNKLLVVVPPHRRKFYNAREFIGTSIQAAFPSSFAELRLGGQCLAIGQFTACAFHSLRAVEIGLRTMAAKLGVNLPFPLVQADWETLIRGIESKVQAMKDLKKGEEKTRC